MPTQKFGITIMDNTMQEINKRYHTDGERSMVINRSLERYFDLLARTRRDLRRLFSDKEMGLILDALNGTAFFDTFGIYLIQHEIADAISMDALDHKWEIDGKALVEKMNALTDAQRLALVDAVQCWWDRVANGEQPEYGEALK